MCVFICSCAKKARNGELYEQKEEKRRWDMKREDDRERQRAENRKWELEHEQRNRYLERESYDHH